ncbi:hypothetical protein GCM10027578_26740 [Spirosoma luteolum]
MVPPENRAMAVLERGSPARLTQWGGASGMALWYGQPFRLGLLTAQRKPVDKGVEQLFLL